eukprot:jgi/Botrbrau1/926/Bobra.0167s0038.3
MSTDKRLTLGQVKNSLTLQDLLPPLLALVISHLDPKSIKALRLTARQFRIPALQHLTRLWVDLRHLCELEPLMRGLTSLTRLEFHDGSGLELARAVYWAPLPPLLGTLVLRRIDWIGQPGGFRALGPDGQEGPEAYDVLDEKLRGAVHLTALKALDCHRQDVELLQFVSTIQELDLTGREHELHGPLEGTLAGLPFLRRLNMGYFSQNALLEPGTPLPPHLATLENVQLVTNDDCTLYVTSQTQLTRLLVNSEMGPIHVALEDVGRMHWLKDLETSGEISDAVDWPWIAARISSNLTCLTSLQLGYGLPGMPRSALASMQLPCVQRLRLTLHLEGDVGELWGTLARVAPALRSLELSFAAMEPLEGWEHLSPGLTSLTSLSLSLDAPPPLEYQFLLRDWPTAEMATSNPNLQKLKLSRLLHVKNLSFDERRLHAYALKNKLSVQEWMSIEGSMSPKQLQKRWRDERLMPYWSVAMEKEDC